MREADKKRENREKLKRQLQDKELEECTFKPNINRKTSQPTLVNLNKFDQDRVPLHERAHEILKQKQDRVQQLRAEREIEQMENLFRPQINQRSDKLAQLKNYQQVQTSVTERLYNDAQDRINKLSSYARDESDCTFTPCLTNDLASAHSESGANDF